MLFLSNCINVYKNFNFYRKVVKYCSKKDKQNKMELLFYWFHSKCLNNGYFLINSMCYYNGKN